MPFHVITGIPGGGKTSLMMELLAQAVAANENALKTGVPILTKSDDQGRPTREAAFQQADGSPLLERPLYAAGIDGLKPGIAEPLDDPTKWQQLPDGSLIFIDEMWKWFGHMTAARGVPPPPHVLGIAEHRHKGLDFIGTTQGPNQIYPFMRPLVSPHWHVVRRFGSQFIDVYKWGELVDEVQSQGARDRATKQTRMLPTKQRGWFQSATAHTIKPRWPWKMVAGVLCVVLALPVMYFAFKALRPSAIASGVTRAPEAGLPADGATPTDGPNKGKTQPLTPEEYAAQFKPRIPGVHGSQPMFDGRKVTAVPGTFCMIGGESIQTRCRCFTEQATVITDIPEKLCREWAVHGRYDPFKAPARPGSNPVSKLAVAEIDPGLSLDGPMSERPPPAAALGVLNPNMTPLEATP